MIRPTIIGRKYDISIYDKRSKIIAEGTLDASREGLNQLLDMIFASNCTAIVRVNDDESE